MVRSQKSIWCYELIVGFRSYPVVLYAGVVVGETMGGAHMKSLLGYVKRRVGHESTEDYDKLTEQGPIGSAA